MNNDRILLSETLDRIADAVDDIRETVNSIDTPIEDVATAVQELGSLKKVSSVEDLEALEAKEGDFCIVSNGNEDIVDWDEDTLSNVLIFPKVVDLEEPLSNEGDYSNTIEMVFPENDGGYTVEIIFSDDRFGAGCDIEIRNARAEGGVGVINTRYYASDRLHFIREAIEIEGASSSTIYPSNSDDIVLARAGYLCGVYPDSHYEAYVGKFIKTKSRVNWTEDTLSKIIFIAKGTASYASYEPNLIYVPGGVSFFDQRYEIYGAPEASISTSLDKVSFDGFGGTYEFFSLDANHEYWQPFLDCATANNAFVNTDGEAFEIHAAEINGDSGSSASSGSESENVENDIPTTPTYQSELNYFIETYTKQSGDLYQYINNSWIKLAGESWPSGLWYQL